ncbi:MAG TPA: hypothetical protein VHF24_10740 [Acidimicrobiales bacterium]|nr:hypothetical protein [Acidimicrobiales bacterium]
MADPNDEALLRDAALEEEGIPELEDQPVGKVLSGETPEGVVPPRDYPLGAEEFGTTAAEDAMGESLAQRVAREVPDRPVGEGLDDEDEALAGRLVQPDLGVVDVAGLSAEEEAMHVEGEPGGLGGGWPGYLQDEHE